MFRFALTVVLVAIAGPGFLIAQHPENSGPAASESDLERPLPPDAVSRLGTTRYRTEGEIKGLAFLADNRTMATSAGWFDVETGARINEFDPRQGPIRQLEVSRDRSRIVTIHAEYDGERIVDKTRIVCWDVNAHIVWEDRWEAHADRVGSPTLAIAPDATVVATSDSEGVRLWDGETGAAIGQPRKIRDYIIGIQFSAEGSSLILWTAHEETLVWNWRDGAEPKSLFEEEDHQRFVAVSPTELAVISARYGESGYRLTSLVDPTVSRLIGRPPENVFVHGATFSADGELLIIDLPSRAVELWDIVTNERLCVFDNLPFTGGRTATSLDGRWMAKTHGRGAILVWDLQKPERVRGPDGHQAYIRAMAFFPDGKRLVSGGADGTVRLWDVESGRQLHVMCHAKDRQRNTVYAVAVSPYGRLIASSGADNAVRLWDAETGREEAVITGNGDRPHSRWLAFAKTKPLLYAWGEGETLRVWDLSSGDAPSEKMTIDLSNAPSNSSMIRSVASGGVGMFAEDSRFFMIQGGEKSDFDVSSRAKIETISAGWSSNACFAPDSNIGAMLEPGPVIVRERPDGSTIVSASREQILQIREFDSGKVRRKIPLEGIWEGPAISSDGRMIVVARRGPNGPTLILDAATGDVTHRIDDYPIDPWWDAVFSPDNRRLAVKRIDTTIDIWDVEKLRVPPPKTP